MGYREEIEDFRAGRLAGMPAYELLNEEAMPPIELAEKPKERKPDEPVEKSVERKPEEPRKPCEPGCTENHVHVR